MCVEIAKTIRQKLKEDFKLSSRDISVTSKFGGLSSAVYVSLKNKKALAFESNIKKMTKVYSSYEKDEKTGEILMGGNTFIFVSLHNSLQEALYQEKLGCEA